MQSKDRLGLNLLAPFHELGRQIKIIEMDHTFKCIRHIDLHRLQSQMKSWSGTCGFFKDTQAH